MTPTRAIALAAVTILVGTGALVFGCMLLWFANPSPWVASILQTLLALSAPWFDAFREPLSLVSRYGHGPAEWSRVAYRYDGAPAVWAGLAINGNVVMLAVVAVARRLRAKRTA